MIAFSQEPDFATNRPIFERIFFLLKKIDFAKDQYIG
jgi:hypothetical protein